MGGREAGFTPDKIRDIKKINISPISLDKPIGNDDDSQFGDFVKDQDIVGPNLYTEKKMLTESLEELLTTILTKKEEKIIRMRHGLTPYENPLTLEEISKKFRITKEAVRQIEVKVLKKLKTAGQSKKLKLFLTGETFN
jgi:RNA polymerase primary sigma factor